MKLENNMLKEVVAELQSKLDIANSVKVEYRKLVEKYQELKDKVQHDTAVKDDLVCVTYCNNLLIISYVCCS